MWYPALGDVEELYKIIYKSVKSKFPYEYNATKTKVELVTQELLKYFPHVHNLDLDSYDASPKIAISKVKYCCAKKLKFESITKTFYYSQSYDSSNSIFLVMSSCTLCETKFYPSYKVKKNNMTVWDVEGLSTADYFCPTRDSVFEMEYMKYIELQLERGHNTYEGLADMYNLHRGAIF